MRYVDSNLSARTCVRTAEKYEGIFVPSVLKNCTLCG